MKVVGFSKLRAQLSRNASQFGQRLLRQAGQLMKIPGLVGRTAYEVKPTSDGWMVALRGSTLPLRVFAKKQDAIREGKRMARSQKSELDIFTRQGSLQTHQSFS